MKLAALKAIEEIAFSVLVVSTRRFRENEISEKDRAAVDSAYEALSKDLRPYKSASRKVFLSLTWEK